MSIKSLLLTLFLSLFLVGTLVGSNPTPTLAQGANNAGITVSPVTDDFTIAPGQSITRTIRVVNPGAELVTLYPQVLNFGTDNDQGRPIFFTLADRHSRFALSEWISFSRSILRIAPGEVEEFEVVIRAPLDAEPGGKYGAVLFSTEEPQLAQDMTQIGVVGLSGTLLLARVPGAIRSHMTIQSFEGPTFLISPPANFTVVFKNSGNIHTRPVGDVRIRNMFGNTVKSLRVNPGNGAVLPESERRFEAVDTDNKDQPGWQFDWRAIGRYTATVAIDNGEQNMTATLTFFIFPLWLILTIVGLILAIVILIIILKKRKNRRQPLVNQIPRQSKQPLSSRPEQPEQKKNPYVMR